MRLGCPGCLTAMMAGLSMVILGGATLWVWAMAYATPALLSANHGRADPVIVERRIAALGHRTPGRAAPVELLVLTDAEVTAVLGRYLDEAGLPISGLQASLRATEVTVQGRVPLSALLEGAPVTWLSSAMPRGSLDAPIRVTLSGTVTVHPGYAEATLLDSRVGRLSIPGWLLTMMAGSRGASLLRWELPGAVERLDVEDGRLTVRTR